MFSPSSSCSLRPSLALLLALLLASCAEGTADPDAETSASQSATDTDEVTSTSGSDESSAESGGATSTDGASSAGDTSSPEPSEPAPPAVDFGVRFVGRVDASDPMGARFAWSGSGLVVHFSGTSLGMNFNGGHQYTVVVDGVVQPKLVTSAGVSTVAEGLEAGEHVVELYRRTEASQGESVFSGLELGASELLDPPAAPERRIEIIGDSITCGYGNEGADMSCGFSPDTENHYLTYGAIAARAVGAELSTVAWSGKGVVCNYGDGASSCMSPLPDFYDRALPNRATSAWDFASWQAHAVVVNLSTNDFSTAEDPTQADFEAAYTQLLERVRDAYPDAVILCTVGPLLSGADLSMARTYIANAVQARVDAGDTQVKTFDLEPQDGANGYGCDWHPSLRTHEIMAETLTSVLRTELGWAD